MYVRSLLMYVRSFLMYIRSLLTEKRNRRETTTLQ